MADKRNLSPSEISTEEIVQIVNDLGIENVKIYTKEELSITEKKL